MNSLSGKSALSDVPHAKQWGRNVPCTLFAITKARGNTGEFTAPRIRTRSQTKCGDVFDGLACSCPRNSLRAPLRQTGRSGVAFGTNRRSEAGHMSGALRSRHHHHDFSAMPGGIYQSMRLCCPAGARASRAATGAPPSSGLCT